LLIAFSAVPQVVAAQESFAERLAPLSLSMDMPEQFDIRSSVCQAWPWVEAPISEQRTSQLAASAWTLTRSSNTVTKRSFLGMFHYFRSLMAEFSASILMVAPFASGPQNAGCFRLKTSSAPLFRFMT
jgi:hypothetical protein